MRWFSLLLLFISMNGLAETRVSGSLSAQWRYFTESPQWPGQLSETQNSVALEPEFRSELKDSKLTFVPFVRHDNRDDERSHADVRELHWPTQGADWDLLIGINRVFWGVAESRHLVDIVNQTDLVENIDGEDKLGQALLQYRWLPHWGALDVFVLPGFRERAFPAVAGRLRSGLPVDTSQAQYQSSAEQQHVDVALRSSHVLDDWDIGLGYFNGTSREPRLLPNSSSSALIPYYDQIQQLSMDVQLTRDAWLWKWESIVRKGQGKTFAAAVGGLEYTLYQIINSTADLGLLIEYLYDDRDSAAPPVFTDDDVFVGMRLAFNDVDDSSVLLGAIIDRDQHERLISLEAGTRLAEHWTLELEARWLVNIDSNSPLMSFQKDDYIQAEVAYYF